MGFTLITSIIVLLMMVGPLWTMKSIATVAARQTYISWHGCGYRWADVIGIGISDPPHPTGAVDDFNLWRGIAFQSVSGGDHHHKPLTHLTLFPSGDGITRIIY
jgi:hypothetical protein